MTKKTGELGALFVCLSLPLGLSYYYNWFLLFRVGWILGGIIHFGLYLVLSILLLRATKSAKWPLPMLAVIAFTVFYIGVWGILTLNELSNYP